MDDQNPFQVGGNVKKKKNDAGIRLCHRSVHWCGWRKSLMSALSNIRRVVAHVTCCFFFLPFFTGPASRPIDRCHPLEASTNILNIYHKNPVQMHTVTAESRTCSFARWSAFKPSVLSARTLQWHNTAAAQDMPPWTCTIRLITTPEWGPFPPYLFMRWLHRFADGFKT